LQKDQVLHLVNLKLLELFLKQENSFSKPIPFPIFRKLSRKCKMVGELVTHQADFDKGLSGLANPGDMAESLRKSQVTFGQSSTCGILNTIPMTVPGDYYNSGSALSVNRTAVGVAKATKGVAVGGGVVVGGVSFFVTDRAFQCMGCTKENSRLAAGVTALICGFGSGLAIEEALSMARPQEGRPGSVAQITRSCCNR
jgi:hypothetical protein